MLTGFIYYGTSNPALQILFLLKKGQDMSAKAGILDGAVKMVLLQFNFGKFEEIPRGLYQKKEENIEDLLARKSLTRGTEFLPSMADISLVKMPENLARAGYQMVDAFFRLRTNSSGHKYVALRFVFVSEDILEETGEFSKRKNVVEKALEKVCQSAVWRTQGFLNPFFKEGGVVKCQHSVSLNMTARNPLLDKFGQSILRWKKNENGEKVGGKPLPIRPALFLVVKEGDIRMESE